MQRVPLDLFVHVQSRILHLRHLYANCKLRQPFVIEVPSDHFVSVFLPATTHLGFEILLKAYMVARFASLV